jgi:Tol biopolymer transport system component
LRRLRGLFVALVAVAAGCESGPASPNSGGLVLIGRREVSATLTAGILHGSDTIAIPATSVSFSPAASVTVLGTSSFLFQAPGTYTLTTTDSGRVLSMDVLISAAPTILFDMVVAGNRDIYRATIYGRDLQRLTTNAATESHPTAAKDKLIFTSYRDGNGELYSRSLSAAPFETRLTITASNETDAALSPDAARLAYTRDDGGTPRIWIADATATTTDLLTTASGATIEGNAAWRPTSDSLLLMSTALGDASIFRASRAAKSGPVSTAKPATADSVFVEPAWSADGKSIAYGAAATGHSSRIMMRNLISGVVVFATPQSVSAGQPVFLPDGRIVFTIFAQNGASSLAWVDPAAPSAVNLIPLTGTDPQHPAIIWP